MIKNLFHKLFGIHHWKIINELKTTDYRTHPPSVYNDLILQCKDCGKIKTIRL